MIYSRSVYQRGTKTLKRIFTSPASERYICKFFMLFIEFHCYKLLFPWFHIRIASRHSKWTYEPLRVNYGPYKCVCKQDLNPSFVGKKGNFKCSYANTISCIVGFRFFFSNRDSQLQCDSLLRATDWCSLFSPRNLFSTDYIHNFRNRCSSTLKQKNDQLLLHH